MITGFYAALLALFQCFLTVRVVAFRIKNKVSLGDGGYDDLQAVIRRHANFIETVPMALILMVLVELPGAELFGLKPFVLHGLGLFLVCGRLLHAYALSIENGLKFRQAGMVLTLSVYVAGAVFCILSFIQS